jgi:CrcB protein
MERLDPVLVGAGGFVGAVLRYGVAVLLGDAAGTLAVNVCGSFVLGALVVAVPGRRAQLLLGTGLLSSFTTYSTFAAEATALGAVDGTLFVAANYGLGVGAALVGRRLGVRAS